MVPNHKGSHYLSKRKAHKVKTYKGDLRKLGHPADCNIKTRTVRQKSGITNQKEVTTNHQKHEKGCKINNNKEKK